MKEKMFKTVMKMVDRHSAALQSLGFSKWFVRDHSLIHRSLVYVAYRLSLKMPLPGSGQE